MPGTVPFSLVSGVSVHSKSLRKMCVSLLRPLSLSIKKKRLAFEYQVIDV